MTAEIQIGNEKYYCNNCIKYLTYFEVYYKWKCPICQSSINIKISIKSASYSCYRVKPSELKENDLVIYHDDIRNIKNISKTGESYRIAFKEYRAFVFTDENVLPKVNGRWHIK